MKKRLLSVLLVVCMLVSLCSAGMGIAVSGADTGTGTGTPSAITFAGEYNNTTHYAGFDEGRMFDGDLSTEWITSWNIGSYVSVNFSASERIIMTGYTLITSSNSEYYQSRQPFKIEMKGRNSPDDSWTVINAVFNETCDVYGNNVSYHYDIPDNTDYYQYYRVTFDLRSGEAGKGYSRSTIGFAELVPDYISCVHDWATDSVVDANCIKPSYTYQHCTDCLAERTLVGAVSDPTGHNLDADGLCLNCGRIDPIVVGPFLLSGEGLVDGEDYLWWEGYMGANVDGLFILSEKPIAITTIDEEGASNGRCVIFVMGNISANLTFDGLIMRDASSFSSSGFTESFVTGTKEYYQRYMKQRYGIIVSDEELLADDWSDQVVTITLKEGSENLIASNKCPITAIEPE